MRERTDHSLLLATARGDEAAFAELVARHRPRLVRYATSRCGRDVGLAEDAVQDGLVRAHRAIVGGKVPVDVEAWLFAIVRNRCHDYFRAAKPTAPLPPELPGGAPSAFEVVEQGERLAGALDAVERLPRAQRTALVGRELEGRSYEELARRQATTVSAVKSLLHRARATLAHQASLPAFVTPLVARLARVRPGQIAMGMIAEHATGAAAIATIALAGTSALGSLHAPGPPAAPTSAQSQAALVAAAHQPRQTRRPRARSTRPGAAARRTRSTRTATPRRLASTRRPRRAAPARHRRRRVRPVALAALRGRGIEGKEPAAVGARAVVPGALALAEGTSRRVCRAYPDEPDKRRRAWRVGARSGTSGSLPGICRQTPLRPPPRSPSERQRPGAASAPTAATPFPSMMQ